MSRGVGGSCPAVCRYLDHFEGLAAASEMKTAGADAAPLRAAATCWAAMRRATDHQHGFQRLVLLERCGYSRAELPLDGAVSLVAPNSTGKTSLINRAAVLRH